MTQQLAQLLDFTQHDLNANRSGRLTERQRAHLQLRRDASSALLSTGVGGLIVVAAVCVGLAQDISKLHVELLFVIPIAFVLAYIIQLWVNFTRDLSARRVDAVSGCATAQRARLRIGHSRFTVADETVATAFQSGAEYRAYYARRSKMLLSAEPI
ncbi:MAG: hypothetical protein IPK17_06300 [Chloroflexi bacterium]|uniref:hypothetical protein n=1 Tax=Candidatus Flexifilum breve TaxID=3140694 RepID=UPI00313666DC|nr:hypothetical protein [Chloroflexota bacterium]